MKRLGRPGLDPTLMVLVWFLLGLGVSASLMEFAPDAEATSMSIAVGLVLVAVAVAAWRGARAEKPRLKSGFRVSAVAAGLIALSLAQRLWNALGSV